MAVSKDIPSFVNLQVTNSRGKLQTGNSAKITDWVNPNDKSGEFKRQASVFRNFISRESGAEFPPEKGRYHLYVSYACPWGMLEN